jgi:hypothetical protein
VFNFNAGVGVTKGSGGAITTANAADFPAVIGNGMAMAVGVMEYVIHCPLLQMQTLRLII